MKKIISLLFALIMIVSLIACGKKSEEWPSSGLAAKIPKPSMGIIDILIDDDDNFSARIEKTNSEFNRNYLNECISLGFDIDVDKNSTSYVAFNNDGYKVDISSYSDSLSISVYSPIELGTLRWPGGIAGSLIPKPDSDKGNTSWEHEDSFFIYVGNMNRENFNDYIEKCREAGFDIDYSRDDNWYRADNEDGYYLSLEYEGFNIMSVKVEKHQEQPASTEPIKTQTETELQTEEQTAEPEPVASTSEKTNEVIVDENTIRTDVKEAIDSYEAFVDEYCEFMKNYDSSDMNKLSDYLEYLQRYYDFLDEFEDIEDMDLTIAEALYYSEVSLRCSEKILEVTKD